MACSEIVAQQSKNMRSRWELGTYVLLVSHGRAKRRDRRRDCCIIGCIGNVQSPSLGLVGTGDLSPPTATASLVNAFAIALVFSTFALITRDQCPGSHALEGRLGCRIGRRLHHVRIDSRSCSAELTIGVDGGAVMRLGDSRDAGDGPW